MSGTIQKVIFTKYFLKHYFTCEKIILYYYLQDKREILKRRASGEKMKLGIKVPHNSEKS